MNEELINLSRYSEEEFNDAVDAAAEKAYSDLDLLGKKYDELLEAEELFDCEVV